jgi:hypothetical protein
MSRSHSVVSPHDSKEKAINSARKNRSKAQASKSTSAFVTVEW